MHGTRRSYVYFLDYSGSTRYDRGYYLHGACGEEVVGSQKGRPKPKDSSERELILSGY